MTTGEPSPARHRAPDSASGHGRRIRRWTVRVLVLAAVIAVVVLGWRSIPPAQRPTFSPTSAATP